MFRKWTGIVSLLLILSPAAAHAEWLFTPSFGTTFGGDTFGAHTLVYGAAIGAMDEDAFGWEADFSFAPQFFEGATQQFAFDGDGSVASAMINVLIGLPVAGQHRTALRPYVTGGVGLMQMRVQSQETLFESNTHEKGWNLGVGVMSFLGEHAGLRADVRYVRSFQNQVPSWTEGLDGDIAPGNFDFWRGSVGVTFRLGN